LPGWFAQLRTTVDGVLSPRFAADEQHAFDAWSAERSVSFMSKLLFVVLVASFVWWPFDYLIHRANPEVVAAIAQWRLAIYGTGAIVFFLFFRHRTWAEKHAYGINALLVAANTLILAHAFSPLGGLSTPWFYAALPTPFATIPILVSFWKRALAIGLTIVAVGVGAFVPHPENLQHPMLLAALITLLFLGVLALLSGHAIFMLVRANYSQARALARRAIELEALNRAKSRFFANVSHELRTPLTLILAGLRGWRARATSEDDVRDSSVAVRNASRLLLLVNELLDLARYEAGHGKPRKKVVDFAALTREVVLSFGSAEGLSVTTQEGPAYADVDAEQVRRILYNLVSNAQKLTTPGQRRIEVEARAEGKDVVIEVTDNGPGVPLADRERIFEPFTQLDQGPSGAGWGVGLALVRGVALAHGGRVHVEDAPGGGARFVVTLPAGDADVLAAAARRSSDDAAPPDDTSLIALLREADAAAAQPFVEPQNGGDADGRPRVLVVEDHAELRSYVARILARTYFVETAENALTALQRMRAHAPDLVLTDMMMPGMTGLELLEAMRAEPALDDVPVIVVTALAAVEARLAALRAGAADYLLKPFDETELVLRVRNSLMVRAHARTLLEQNVDLSRANTALEERLAVQLEEVRHLAAHLDTLREEERRRIARELHDELGQLLTAMRYDADRCRKHAVGDPDKSSLALGRISTGIDELLSHVRRIVADMRPQVLDDLGLATAAGWLCASIEERGDVAVLADIDPACTTRLGREAASALYRILQEALNNVVKHARASRAHVRIYGDNGDVLLEVSDDGLGLPETPRAPAGRRQGGGFGMIGMRERARAVGGTFSAQRRQRGTRIEVRVPASADIAAARNDTMQQQSPQGVT